MAGEAVSRTSLTLAFQKKQNLEWRKLRERLHLQLQQDISRTYVSWALPTFSSANAHETYVLQKYFHIILKEINENSGFYLYLFEAIRKVLAFDSSSIQTHRSILEVRASRFFTELCTIQPAPHSSGLQSVLLNKGCYDYLEGFIRSLYTKCSVTDEEIAIQCLEGVYDPISSKGKALDSTSSGDSGLSPESDIYLTPKSSPSEIYQSFEPTNKLNFEVSRNESRETFRDLQKTNRSYYTIVQVDETFIEENSKVSDAVLEKELAEQDELLKSFRSIKSKEEKKSIIRKPNKPTSLPFSSSQFTKKKQTCDIPHARERKDTKVLFSTKYRCKEDSTNVNLNYCSNQCNVINSILKSNAQKKDKIVSGKFEYKQYTTKEEKEREINVGAYSSIKSIGLSSGPKNECTNNDIIEEEEFMESPGEGMACELECCKKKEIITDDFLNFPCSPEMDASVAGPDSGLDTSSTGCIPGGGFSSPREHTVSETSGVDLTEAAIGEDMPHDGDVELLLRKPVKSSTSSSVSSDAGTWDSTFPSAHQTEVEYVEGTDLPINTDLTSEQILNKNKVSQEIIHSEFTNVEGGDIITKEETSTQHTVKEPRNLAETLPRETKNGTFVLEGESSIMCTSKQNLHSGPSSIAAALINPDVSSQIEINSSTFDSIPFCSEGSSSWKLSNQNNYFINAADLADDAEMLLPPASTLCDQTVQQTEKTSPEADVSELEVQKSSSTPSPCEETVSSTCEIVNKGIMDCLNIKAKFTSMEALPIETDKFTDDSAPFLSHLSMTDDKILNSMEQHTENTFQTTSEGPVSEHLLMKLTPFKTNNGKQERVSSKQDIFAEFEKEIKLTEHLDPHINIRKVHRMDSSGSDDMNKKECHSLPTDIFSDSDRSKPHISGSLDVSLRVKELENSSETSICDNADQREKTSKRAESLTVDQRTDSEKIGQENLANEFESSQKERQKSVEKEEKESDDLEEKDVDEAEQKEGDETEQKEGDEAEQKEDEDTEQRRPSLIRRNTFELDPDDEHLTVLRQEYERRQGNALFQSCIPQFSGHLTGSEGFRDAQSLMMVSSKSEILNVDEIGQNSLPIIPAPITTLASSVSYEEPVIQSQSFVANPSHIVVPSGLLSSLEIHPPESLNDNPLGSLFHSQVNPSILTHHRSKSHPFGELISREPILVQEKKCNGSFDMDDGEVKENPSDYSSEKEERGSNPRGDIKRMSGSFDNSTKPVISGALTCSDVVVDEKRSTDSPKKQKRTESTPIVSGGVSCSDFVVPPRPTDSPLMARRKNESAPILSGGATMIVDPEPEKPEVKLSTCTVKSAWVVDMSDCTSVASKPPLEPRKQKKTDAESTSVPENEVKATSSLGFFVDLKDSPPESQASKKSLMKEKKEEKDKSHESSPGRRNSGVGFFIDLKEPTDASEKKIPVERKQSSDICVEESKPPVKNISCGFFIHLKEDEHKTKTVETVVENKIAPDSEVEKKTPGSDKKNAIFSMFIDIGEGGSKQDTPTKQGSTESLRGKMQSPHVHKKLGFKPNVETVPAADSRPAQCVQGTESPKSTFMFIDANHPPSKTSVSSKTTSQEEIEHKENKKQGFYMFIETESPVTRRKTLPSGLKPNVNRHSWNLEPRVGDQVDEQSKGNGRRHHKRAHSLSVERGSVCTPSDESRSSSTASLAKSRMRGSSQSLHESITSPEQGSSQFGDGISSKQMSSSCHSRLPSKSYDRLPKRTLSYEGKSDSGKETPDIETISEGKLESDTIEQDSSKDAEDNDATRNLSLTSEDSCVISGAALEKSSHSSNHDLSLSHDERELSKSRTDSKQKPHQKEISRIDVEERTITDAEARIKEVKVTEMLSTVTEVKREVESKSLETSFVKLSDLDKEPPKTAANDNESSDILPSFATSNRMTRSIPETSWIESKLLMTRSIGGGTSSKSLSRLFPHLHTTASAMNSPSNICRSKSPNTQAEADDNETQVSETSDLSSMQSSMGPSGLEGSTEETDASSSYAGRSGPVSRLGEDLLRMFLEEINPDVTVEVGGRRLKAHKCILSSRCQYFAAILSGGWVESAGNVISLQGFSYNAVHFALCHIYSGTSNIPDTISIVELATLADMLGLEGLKEVIMYTLKVKYCHFFHKPCTMCAAGVLECLPLAAAYGLDEIYRKSLRWITKYFVRIWPTKGFASLPRELIDKCYQQHVVHMTVDNILETVMCCDKLLATLPNVRWAEPVFGITSQLLEASIKFIANNFCGVLSSDSFLSLGKELSWNISRLEDSLMAATDRLPPDQACQSHTRLHNFLTVAQSSDPPPEMHWSPNFVELLHRIQKRVEACLVRQAPRAARCPSWSQMDLELRKKIQEAACLVLVPGEEGHKSRHSSLAKRGEAGGNSVYCTAPRSISSTGSRSLDIRQVKLAMTQQARRAASGGRVSALRADTRSRSQSAKKTQQPSNHVPTHKAETVASQAKKVVQENGEATARPKTWPLRVLENKPKSSKQKTNSSSSSMGTPEKSGAMPRRTGKTMISSSDSSRTSSPAMRRSTSSGEGSGRGRAPTVGSGSNRNLIRRSETPPGKELRNKKRKDGEVTMSTDSLSEPHSQSNGSCKRIRELTDSVTSRSCISTRPDTPSVRRKLREEIAISTDSLSESAVSAEKLPVKVETSLSAPSRSLGSTRPDTPPVKERGRKCLGRIGVDVSMSTDSLANAEQTSVSVTGENSSIRKVEVNKIVPIPKSPVLRGSPQIGSRFDGSKGNLTKGVKAADTRSENGQPRSPASTARRAVMRQTIVSPRDSPTFRLRSGITSSPYTGSPSLRRSLLLASRSPTNDNSASVNNNAKMATPTKATAAPAKSEKVVVKSLSSPSTSVTINKRTPNRLQTRNQPVASPVKSSGGVSRSTREAGKTNTPSKGVVTSVSKTNNNTTRKVVANGAVNGRNKQNNNDDPVQNEKVETSKEKPPLTVGSRSGTFLKDEPTILKKPDVDNVQE